jgi:hypothetical protein
MELIMDSELNFEVLQYLIDSDHLAENSPARGIAKKIIADKKLDGLSEKQRNVFDKIIIPLLKPDCEGVFGDGPDNCNGNGLVDDASLMLSYREDNMLCQTCRHDKQSHDSE